MHRLKNQPEISAVQAQCAPFPKPTGRFNIAFFSRPRPYLAFHQMLCARSTFSSASRAAMRTSLSSWAALSMLSLTLHAVCGSACLSSRSSGSASGRRGRRIARVSSIIGRSQHTATHSHRRNTIGGGTSGEGTHQEQRRVHGLVLGDAGWEQEDRGVGGRARARLVGAAAAAGSRLVGGLRLRR